MSETRSPLRVVHEGWPTPLIRPAMSNTVDRHDRISITNRYVEADGAPFVPVTGELHYSRVPREQWDERLALLRSSGITTVASYLFWIHHEEVRGEARFDDNLDVAHFVEAAGRAGLDVVLRIGPWCHGETRNGGFPDWVVESGVRLRTDDPAYLAMVRHWFARLGDELAHLCGPAGNVVAIQIENELYDRPDHILTLKGMAREAGLVAPLWTATGWGGAELPRGEVVPLFAAYSDGFWVEPAQAAAPASRSPFFFSEIWDDPGVGADQDAGSSAGTEFATLDPSFPPATCEMGGGMATAYHRRPRPAALDIAAIANCKLGNGSAWQGFYMYAGGVNPPGIHGMQESHATEYPNDMPRFDYDFQAPIGSTGRPNETLGLLREQNVFAATFGGRLATMRTSLPEVRPEDFADTSTLRWALRSDGDSGFVFISWHQPHAELATYRGARFRVELDDETILFPDTPIDIPSGTLARFPVALMVGDVRIDWATATPITIVDGAVPLLVLRAHAGIAPRIRVNGNDAVALTPGVPVRIDDSLEVLAVDDDIAPPSQLWAIDGRLLRSVAPLWSSDGLRARSIQKPVVEYWDPESGSFRALDAHAPAAGRTSRVAFTLTAPASPPPADFGSFAGNASAPTEDQFEAIAAHWEIEIPTPSAASSHRELVIDWLGDVAQFRQDGVTVADRFWDGAQWRLSLPPEAEGNRTIHVSPLDKRMPVDLTEAAAEKVPDRGSLCEIAEVRLEESVEWHLRFPVAQ